MGVHHPYPWQSVSPVQVRLRGSSGCAIWTAADQAEDAAATCLEILSEREASELEKFLTGFVIELPLLQALTRLLPACGAATHRSAIDILSDEERNWSDVALSNVVQALNAVNPDALDAAAVAQLASFAAETGQSKLQAESLALAARAGHEPSQARLLELANDDDFDALAALEDATLLNPTAASRRIERESGTVRAIVSAAHKGKFGMRAHDPAQTLALLNIWFPEAASWEPLVSLLTDETVAGEHKRNTCLLLAERTDQVPVEVRVDLAERFDEIAATKDRLIGIVPGLGGAASRLGLALGVFGDAAIADYISRSLSGGEPKRADLAESLGGSENPEPVGALISLCHDSDITVRSSAASALVRGPSTRRPSAIVMKTLDRLLANDGGRVATGLMRGAWSTQDDPVRSKIAQGLADHPSAIIRRHATSLDIETTE